MIDRTMLLEAKELGNILALTESLAKLTEAFMAAGYEATGRMLAGVGAAWVTGQDAELATKVMPTMAEMDMDGPICPRRTWFEKVDEDAS